MTVLDANIALPDVERQPDVLVDIGGEHYRVYQPKLMAWRTAFLALHSNDRLEQAVAADDFLRHCMDPDDWDRLIARLEDRSTDLDWHNILAAGERVSMHYEPHLGPQVQALGLVLSDLREEQQDGEDQVDAPPAVQKAVAAKKTATKKTATKKTAAKKSAASRR